MRQETIEGRAVKIAARILQENGFCPRPKGCTRVYLSDEGCTGCIKRYLIGAAKRKIAAKRAVKGEKAE